MYSESRETYTLLLATSKLNSKYTNAAPLNSALDALSLLSNLTWRVDWDNLFKDRIKLFKHCRVRYDLISNSVPDGISTVSLTWAKNMGYLSANFGDQYNAQTTNGTILGFIYPITTPNKAEASAVLISSRLNDIGVDINPEQLKGIQPLNIRLINPLGNIQNQNLQYTSAELQYELILYFELYND